MVQRPIKVSDNKEFITSDRWKCDKSPSGAHYWLVQCYQMTCKYCNCSKTVNTGRFGWSKPEE